jgi:DNA-binding NarL/FixJ family response regulator
MEILHVDDHRAVRHALCALFADEPDIEIVGEAADGPGGAAPPCRRPQGHRI